MQVSRRDLAKLLAVAAGAGLSPWRLEAADGPARLLAFEPLGNVTLLHVTDTHATLRPVFYREPDTLLSVGAERGRPPFLTGADLLHAYHVAPGSIEAYAYTYLDFPAGRAIRPDGWLRPPGDTRQADAGRAERAHAAPGRRRHPPGLGDRPLEPRRGHGAGLEPARRGRAHAALGVRPRPRACQGAVRRSRAQGALRRRLRRSQRDRAGMGRASLPFLYDPGGRRH